MKEEQKIYIKGNIERGSEVIKILTDLGGRNSHAINGKNVNAYYFINPNGIIVNNYLSGSEVFSFVKEFYKEVELPRWKPEHTGRYFYINTIGEIIENVWCGIDTNESHYEFGNCFRTPQEAETARDKIEELLKHT